MPNYLKKYLGDDVPLNERIFYLATFSSSVAGMLFVSFAILIRLDILSVCLYASICLLATVLFFYEKKVHKTTLFSIVFLSYVNLFAFPAIFYLQKRSLVEIPLYSIIGLCYALVLLDGIKRIIMFVLQSVIDIAMAYYCFVYRFRNTVNYGATSIQDYARLEIAIVVTGIMCGLIVIFRNRFLEKELLLSEKATEKAEAVSDAKDTFLVNVSHEIRTPLNAIIGTTEMILNEDINNHLKEMTFNISNSSHALLSITSDLLDFSRMNIDSLTIDNESYDISSMLNDIINLMSVRLLDTNVEFSVNVNPNLYKNLIGDSAKIRQIISNMLSNAIKFTPEGYMKLIVDFEDVDDETIKLKIVVEDSGIGIEKENLDKIFEPAAITRKGKFIDDNEGTGLGLALCNRLCKLMNGSLGAQSVVGEGSTFYFEVDQGIANNKQTIGTIKSENKKVCYFSDSLREMTDLDKVMVSMGIDSFGAFSEDEFINEFKHSYYEWFLLSSVSYERIKEKMAASSIDWDKVVVISNCNYSYSGEPFANVITKPVSSLNVSALFNGENSYSVINQRFESAFTIPEATILIVDDNLVNLDVAAGLLERYGCRVITAASGKESLITLQDEHIDMIFLDYMMPDMDGIDTLNAIRALNDEKFKKLPIICLTANVVSGAKEMFLNAGFDGYLSKPIETDMLEKSILENLPKEFIRASIRKD